MARKKRKSSKRKSPKRVAAGKKAWRTRVRRGTTHGSRRKKRKATRRKRARR
jgi:hypothetical protein